MKTLIYKFLYESATFLYALLVTLIIGILHLLQYYIIYLLYNFIPSLNFIISYAIISIIVVIAIYGKYTVSGFRKIILRLEQKEKLKNLL